MGNLPRFVRAPRALAVGASAAALFALASIALAGEGSPARAPTAAREDPLRELGRRLFFDPAASRMGMRSCADCHDPGHGYSDTEKTSRDDASPTKRHSQTIVDTGDSPSGHWDGEFKRIEDVVRSRLNLQISENGQTQYGSGNGFEASNGRRMRVVARQQGERSGGGRGGVGAIPTPDSGRVDPDAGLAAAIAAADASPAADDAAPGAVGVDVLPAAPRAADVFSVPAGAATEPLAGFVDPKKADSRLDVASNLMAARRYEEGFAAAFGTEGVTVDRVARAVERYCHSVRSGESPYDRHAAGKDDALSASAKRGLALFRGAAGCATCHTVDGPRAKFTDYAFHNTGISWKGGSETQRPNAVDNGAQQRTGRTEHLRAFKTPTLRDVARRGPYMHDGSLATLEAVVRHYAAGSAKDPAIDEKFPSFTATDADVADLVAFLESLTSDRRPGLAATAWGRRAEETRLEFVDAAGKPLAGQAVALVPAGDVLPGFAPAAKVWARTTGADGSLTFTAPYSTHVRILLPDGLSPAGGDLVPDTCRRAVVVVPVRGKATLMVSFPKGATVPEYFVATHPDAPLFPERRHPASVLRRRDSEPAADGGVQAVYETPYRTDVGAVAEIALPKPAWGLKTLRVFLDPDVAALLTLP